VGLRRPGRGRARLGRAAARREARLTWKTTNAIAAAAALAGGLGGWKAHKPPPAKVELREVVRWREREQKATAIDEKRGPVRVVERWHIVPGPGCNAPAEEHERITEEAPSETRTDAVETRTTSGEQQVDLRIVQAPRPSWAVYGGLQLVPEKLPVIGVSRRLVGPIWLEAWARPRLELAVPAAGVGVRVEF